MTSLFIATPTADGQVTAAYTYALAETADLLARAGVRWRPCIYSGAPTLQARNILNAKFLASGYSHILHVDSDMGWKAADITRLIAASKTHPVCCGVGRKKTDEVEFGCNFIVESGAPVVHPATGYFKLLDVGAAFLLIARTEIERMIAAYPERKTLFRPERIDGEADYEYALFDSFREDGRYLEGDYGFCRLLQRIGGEVWADPEITLSHHIGTKFYAGKLADLVVET